MHLLSAILGAVVLAWLAAGTFLLWNVSGVTILRPSTLLPAPPTLPRVSIIVPARNEEEALPAALDSLLDLDYPDYEIILVDDDSRDGTGRIADEYACRPENAAKLRVIHNQELPPGWRGKVHALSLGEQSATGDWVLSTDADVVMHPALLRLAVSLAHETGAALVSVAPELDMGSFGEKIVMPAFAFLLAMLCPPRLVNRKGSRRALGAGAFLLMRRDALGSLGGYAKLRNTLIEDLRMAEMFKHNGFSIYLALARGLFCTRMYQDWREMFEGLSRSAFEGAGSSVLKVLAGLAVGNGMAVLPWAVTGIFLAGGLLGWTSPAHNPAFLLALGAAAVSALVYAPVVVYFGLSPLFALALPVATLFYSAAAATSAALTLAGPGLRWKGRVYQPPAP